MVRCQLVYVTSCAVVASVLAARFSESDLSNEGCGSASIQKDWDERGLTTVRVKESGRAYVACPGGKEQKVSCLPQECADGGAWCFVENYCGSWLWACTKLAGFDLRCPTPTPPEQVKPLSSWVLLGLTNYTVAGDHDGDWFSHADVYAKVTLQPSGRSYTSDVRVNANNGHLDFHLYVLRSEMSAEVALYDKDTWTSDDLIGSRSVKISGDDGTFDSVLTKGSAKTGAVQGYVATGEELERRAASLSMRGRAPLFGHRDQTYAMAVISNDRVEHELMYAKTGSVVPEVLHGIWWMDQRGKHLPIPSDPSYKQECESAADELLVTWGEGNWDPEALCFRDVFVAFGSPNKGMWTHMNSGDNTGDGWNATNAISLMADFCFTDGTFQKIELHLKVRVGGLLDAALGYTLPESIDGYVEVPRAIMALNMVKKPWGWDRETVLGPDARKLRGVLRGDFHQWLDNVNKICHYPVFQIVDGNGERTEHYDAYLAWANTDFPECAGENQGFDCPWNMGKGTSLVGRLAVG